VLAAILRGNISAAFTLLADIQSENYYDMKTDLQTHTPEHIYREKRHFKNDKDYYWFATYIYDSAVYKQHDIPARIRCNHRSTQHMP